MKRLIKYIFITLLIGSLITITEIICDRQIYIISYVLGLFYLYLTIKLNSLFKREVDILWRVLVISWFILFTYIIIGNINYYYFETQLWNYDGYKYAAFNNKVSLHTFGVTYISCLVTIVLNDCLNYYVLRKNKRRPIYTILFGNRLIILPKRKD